MSDFVLIEFMGGPLDGDKLCIEPVFVYYHLEIHIYTLVETNAGAFYEYQGTK